jgi:hypothetical protein
MINRIFFISKNLLFQDDRPAEENIYFSLLVDCSLKGSLTNAYMLLADMPGPPLALTLDVREPLTAETSRSVTAFLFVVSYLTLKDRPVVNLTGASMELLRETASELSAYFLSQGIKEPLIHLLLSSEGEGDLPPGGTDDCRLFYSEAVLTGYYKQVLQSEQNYNRDLFFYAPSGEALQSCLLSLRQAEMDFNQQSPVLYARTCAVILLEKELYAATKKLSSTKTELDHQKQYVEVLRSDHAAREIQDFYTKEYEILPLWYKRFGHILKVLAGKRTFRSLFRDDVKKYKV